MPKSAIQAQKRTRRARLVLDLTGDRPEIEDSENVRVVDDIDSGNFVIHFARPFPDELYRCDVIPSEPVDYWIKARSREGVGIEVKHPWPRRLKIVCEQV